MSKRQTSEGRTITSKRTKTEQKTPMANPQGYIIIKRENAQPPPEELFAAVESYIGKAKFQEMRGSIADEVGAQRVNGGDASEALLHHGINVSLHCSHGDSSLKLTSISFQTSSSNPSSKMSSAVLLTKQRNRRWRLYSGEKTKPSCHVIPPGFVVQFTYSAQRLLKNSMRVMASFALWKVPIQ